MSKSRRSGRAVLAVLCSVAMLGLAATVDAQGTWQIGAATIDTTPPLFDAAADAAMFPLCPPAVFDGPRIFGLQEPYRDLDGSRSPRHSSRPSP